uniref:Fibronectin type-III domain-containing protein n=1 Tax=Periophthalmus magnuspinnatus TaxID=409849 RepID=A0A3B3ZDP5_9GOBI
MRFGCDSVLAVLLCSLEKLRHKTLWLLNFVDFCNYICAHSSLGFTLVLCVPQPVSEEQQSGEDFGYIVAFRPVGSSTWIQSVMALPDASRYVYRNDSLLPLSQYEVRVGVFNSVGEGPFSRTITVLSAEEEPSEAPSRVWARSVSSSEIDVFWETISSSSSTEEGSEVKDAERVRVANSTVRLSSLKPSTVYLISVRAQNSAGLGPGSPPFNITTKKPPPSQPPGNIEWNLTNSKIFLNWKHVKALENESEVTGYKVVYRPNWNSRSLVLETRSPSVELHVPSGDDYLIEIKAQTEGGDGASSGPIRIPMMSSKASLFVQFIRQVIQSALQNKKDIKITIQTNNKQTKHKQSKKKSTLNIKREECRVTTKSILTAVFLC